MTSVRGRGRGGRGGGNAAGGDSFRRGSWRAGPPGSAGYNRNSGAPTSSTPTPTRPSQGGGKGAVPGAPPGAADERIGNGFQTDTDISGAGRGGERELKPWSADDFASGSGPNAGTNGAGAGDVFTFGAPSNVPWDQFETNERMFGAKTDYDEELYTTKLDRSGPGYKKRERDAERLAQEILTKTSVNTHVAEERGQVTAGDGKDEEEKYSGVVRSAGAYVPPGARKPGSGGLSSGRKDTVKPDVTTAQTTAPATPLPASASPAPAPAPAAAQPPVASAAAPATAQPPTASTANPNGEQATPVKAPIPAVSEVPVPLPEMQTPTPSTPAPRNNSADPAIDPAIASLGDSSLRGATTMTRSTSSVPQGQANGGQAPNPTSVSPAPPSIPPIGAVVDQARQFVNLERERVEARKQSMAKTERAHVLADLRSWQQKFKVPLPIPKDILPILSKDEIKQKEIKDKADKTLHEVEERRRAAKSPSPSRPSEPAPVAAAVSTTKLAAPAPTSVRKIHMKIPEIPPFRKKVPPTVPVPETAAQNISLITSPTPSNASLASGSAAHAKLNPNASAFVFKPGAPAFKPGEHPPASSSNKSNVTSPASQPAKLPPSPATQANANPFYPNGPPKKITVNPRDDFNPFKHGGVPPASSVSPQWPYTGRRLSVPYGGPPMHPMSMQPGGHGGGSHFEGSAGEGQDPTASPHQGPPPQIIPGIPPNMVPFYRYQPGIPPSMSGGMLGPMFAPGAQGFMPQQMQGSPHLGQPPQQGPNGMPMYFPNNMPPNHFIPSQMHFHPNGPGRPGPGGPMFYPGQMPGQPHQAPQMQPQMSFQGQPSQPHFQQQPGLPGQGGPGGVPGGPGGPPQPGFDGMGSPAQQHKG